MSITSKIDKLCQDIRTFAEKRTLEPKNLSLSSEGLALELRIDAYAREAFEELSDTPLHNAKINLQKARTQLLQNYTPKGIARAHFNLSQNITSTPTCPALKEKRVPTISTYQTIAPHLCTIRLDSLALTKVPPRILEKLGDLSKKQVELNVAIIDGRFLGSADYRPLNLSAHTWAYPTILPGADVHVDVNMGLFEGMGYTREVEWDGRLAFDDLSPMRVHVHPRGEYTPERVYSSLDMLYSPDNAHFRLLPESPFTAHWAVTCLDDRVGITKTIVLFDDDHPIGKAIKNAVNAPSTMFEFIERLNPIGEAISKTFKPLKDLLDKERSIERLFSSLPSMFQEGIFFEAWKLKEKPETANFGAKSFKQDESLPAEQRCSVVEQRIAIENYQERLYNELVVSLAELTVEQQPLIKNETVIKMMRCASLFFQDKQEEGYKFFHSFSAKEQQSIYGATWHLIGCKISDDIGRKTFESDQFPAVSKAQALLLAASQLSNVDAMKAASRPGSSTDPKSVASLFGLQPLVLPSPARASASSSSSSSSSLLGLQPLVLPSPARASASSSSSSSSSSLGLQPLVLPSHARAPASISSSSPAKLSSQPVVLPEAPSISVTQRLLALISTEAFTSKTNEARSKEVSELLALLPEEERNMIYGNVYQNSTDPHKGGDRWGELHVGDNLDVLMNAILG